MELGQFVLVIAACGVGADLFTLPLLATSLLAFFGRVELPPDLSFMGTPAMMAAVALLVTIEAVVDAQVCTIHDKSICSGGGACRPLWSKFQLAGSCCVSLVVVLSLSGDLSTGVVMGLIASSLMVVGVVKIGALSRLDDAVGMVRTLTGHTI